MGDIDGGGDDGDDGDGGDGGDGGGDGGGGGGGDWFGEPHRLCKIFLNYSFLIFH